MEQVDVGPMTLQCDPRYIYTHVHPPLLSHQEISETMKNHYKHLKYVYYIQYTQF